MIEVVSRTARVLIVEDEKLVAMAVEDVLRGAGFETVAAPNDDAAYAALRVSGAAFDALVIDINLGEGTTGFDVARFARKLDPEIPVIYLSGGSPDWVTAFGVTGAEFLAKPFDDAELVETVDRTINRRGGGNAPNSMPLPT